MYHIIRYEDRQTFIPECRTADRDDIVMDINYNLEILLLLRCGARLLIVVISFIKSSSNIS